MGYPLRQEAVPWMLLESVTDRALRILLRAA